MPDESDRKKKRTRLLVLFWCPKPLYAKKIKKVFSTRPVDFPLTNMLT